MLEWGANVVGKFETNKIVEYVYMNLIFFCCRPTRHSRLYLQAILLIPLRQNVLKKMGWTFFSLFDFVVQNILWSDDAGANDVSTCNFYGDWIRVCRAMLKKNVALLNNCKRVVTCSFDWRSGPLLITISRIWIIWCKSTNYIQAF